MNPNNHLGDTTSPYLQQHADNPVNWLPWGEKALNLARQQDKPILLSIGYSACHWCHVMAHESFENEATAAVMNELYVNIKVDREERPDLDKIYQTAHHLMAQRGGGWPLTLLLSPDDHTPFFTGTYFPPEPRHNLPAFTDLLRRGEAFFRQNRQTIAEQRDSLIEGKDSMTPTSTDHVILDAVPLDSARTQLGSSFDDIQGGFGSAPKFPHPTHIERLLRHWAATRIAGQADTKALEIALFSLRKMANGGLFDHLGGGFCRYSTDDQWMIPHFEKMLYDNGPLLTLYADAWKISNEDIFQDAGVATAGWVMREMQSDTGGYYSAQDADSEGEEGKFYVWTPDEIKAILDTEEMELFATRFGLDREANFEGKWYPHGYRSEQQVAEHSGQSLTNVRRYLASARDKLLKKRSKRIAPGRDDKVLGSWNALMIKGMLRAANLFGRPEFQHSAENAMAFVRSTLWSNNRLLATYKDGHAHLNAYLDDYAYLIDALLELLQTRWDSADLKFACELADVLLDQFEDKDHGGFFFTSHDHEDLLHRPKPLADEAIPSGNGIAASVLTRLGHLTGDTRYLDAARRTLEFSWPAITRFSHGHNALLLALEETLHPPELIVIRGATAQSQAWCHAARDHYTPTRMVFSIDTGISDLPEALASKIATERTRAYICRGTECLPPIDGLEELKQILS